MFRKNFNLPENCCDSSSKISDDLFLGIYHKLGRWMPPRLDARGRRTIRIPLCTPLVSGNVGKLGLDIMLKSDSG